MSPVSLTTASDDPCRSITSITGEMIVVLDCGFKNLAYFILLMRERVLLILVHKSASPFYGDAAWTLMNAWMFRRNSKFIFFFIVSNPNTTISTNGKFPFPEMLFTWMYLIRQCIEECAVILSFKGSYPRRKHRKPGCFLLFFWFFFVNFLVNLTTVYFLPAKSASLELSVCVTAGQWLQRLCQVYNVDGAEWKLGSVQGKVEHGKTGWIDFFSPSVCKEA